MCRRGQTAEIRRIIHAVRDALPARVGIHAFGVKKTILSDRATADASAVRLHLVEEPPELPGGHPGLDRFTAEERLDLSVRLRVASSA